MVFGSAAPGLMRTSRPGTPFANCGASQRNSSRSTLSIHATATSDRVDMSQKAQGGTQYLRPHMLKLAPYTPIEPFEVLSARCARAEFRPPDSKLHAHVSRRLVRRTAGLHSSATACGVAIDHANTRQAPAAAAAAPAEQRI